MATERARRMEGPSGPVHKAKTTAPVKPRYYKEKARLSHGWNIFDRVTGFYFWLSDANVADKVLDHLNGKV